MPVQANVSSYKEKVTKAKGFRCYFGTKHNPIHWLLREDISPTFSSPPGCTRSYFSILCKMRHPAVCVMGNFALTLAVYVLYAFPTRLC